MCFEIILVNLIFVVCGGFATLSTLAKSSYVSWNSLPCSFLVRVGHKRDLHETCQWK